MTARNDFKNNVIIFLLKVDSIFGLRMHEWIVGSEICETVNFFGKKRRKIIGKIAALQIAWLKK